jgi:GntR family transcriptional regulator
MGLWIQISAGSNEPIYNQIAEQVGQAIARGQLSAGDRLPPVRKLAAELVINPNTVARAYEVLERAGLVTTKTGSGTFVSDPKLRSGSAADMNMLAERMDTIIGQGLNLGFENKELLALFRRRLGKFVRRLNMRKKK